MKADGYFCIKKKSLESIYATQTDATEALAEAIVKKEKRRSIIHSQSNRSILEVNTEGNIASNTNVEIGMFTVIIHSQCATDTGLQEPVTCLWCPIRPIAALSIIYAH